MARGSIKKRPDTGRWRARLRDQHGRPVSRDFNVKAAAERWQRETLRAVEAGTYVRPAEAKRIAEAARKAAEQSTVAAVHALWRKGLDLKPKTLISYDGLWSCWLADRWGDVPVTDVRLPQVKAWLAELRYSKRDPETREQVLVPISASRKRHLWHVLSSSLATAVADGVLAANPLAGVPKGTLPKLPPVDREKPTLTRAEIVAVAAHAGQRYGTSAQGLILAMGRCGLRIGEATALRVRDVDQLHGRLAVPEAKSAAGVRKVPMGRELREIATIDGRGPDDLLFPNSAGGRWDGTNFNRRALVPALKAVAPGHPTERPAHGLRHSAITNWIEVDRLTVAVASKLAGHANASFTQDRYGHLVHGWLDEAAEVMDRPDTAVPRVRLVT